MTLPVHRKHFGRILPYIENTFYPYIENTFPVHRKHSLPHIFQGGTVLATLEFFYLNICYLNIKKHTLFYKQLKKTKKEKKRDFKCLIRAF